jgi:hypothetical protein
MIGELQRSSELIGEGGVVGACAGVLCSGDDSCWVGVEFCLGYVLLFTGFIKTETCSV